MNFPYNLYHYTPLEHNIKSVRKTVLWVVRACPFARDEFLRFHFSTLGPYPVDRVSRSLFSGKAHVRVRTHSLHRTARRAEKPKKKGRIVGKIRPSRPVWHFRQIGHSPPDSRGCDPWRRVPSSPCSIFTDRRFSRSFSTARVFRSSELEIRLKIGSYIYFFPDNFIIEVDKVIVIEPYHLNKHILSSI